MKNTNEKPAISHGYRVEHNNDTSINAAFNTLEEAKMWANTRTDRREWRIDARCDGTSLQYWYGDSGEWQ